MYPAGRICSKGLVAVLFEPATLRLLQVVRPIGCFTWSANDKADIYSRKLYQAELPRDICVSSLNDI